MIVRVKARTASRLAGAFLIVSAGFLAVAVGRALVPERPVPARGEEGRRDGPPTFRRARSPEEEVLVAVANDPFHRERGKMPEPATPDGVSPDSAPAAPVGEGVRLLGTGVLPGDRSFVVCQWPGEPPVLLRVGASLRDLTLEAVQPGRARFRTAGGERIEIQVPKAGA